MELFLDCEQWVLLPPWTPPAREVLAAVWKRKTWSVLLRSERRRANGQYTGSSSWSWGSTTRSSRCGQCGHIPFSFRHSPLRVQTLLSFPTPPAMSLLKTLFLFQTFWFRAAAVIEALTDFLNECGSDADGELKIWDLRRHRPLSSSRYSIYLSIYLCTNQPWRRWGGIFVMCWFLWEEVRLCFSWESETFSRKSIFDACCCSSHT